MERFTISKSEKQTIYEIYRACRLCGAGGGYRMPIIQNIIDLDSSEVELSKKIQECLQLECRPDDRMPPLICELCVDKLNDFYQFLELTRQTDVKTRTRLGLPLQTAKRGEPEPSDCILGVTEPLHVKDDEPSVKKSKAGPKSKKIKREPEVVEVKVESPSGPSSRSSSLSSRSSRSAGPAPPAPVPVPPPAPSPSPSLSPSPSASAPARAAGPRSRRRPEQQQQTHTQTKRQETEKPADTPAVVKQKKARLKELETLLEDSKKYDDNALLVPRTLKRTREEPPRPALLPKRARPAPTKEPVKEASPPRGRPGPKSRRPEIRVSETKVPETPPEKIPVTLKVYKAKKPQETIVKVKPPPLPPSPPPPPPSYVCMVCGVQLRSSSGFSSHMRIHPPTYTKPQNACNPCGKWFTTSEEAAVHHTYHRAATFPYHCRNCFNDYRTLTLYDQHIEKGQCSVAEETPDVPCEACGSSFPTHTLRDKHHCTKPTVAGKCSHCSKPYALLKNLKKHERQCNQRKKRDLIADPDVLRRLKPMQVRIVRCDDLVARAQGDHCDVSAVKPTYGLAKNYVYPYLKLTAVKPEPLRKDSMVAIPVPVNDRYDTDRYTHWDSDSDSENVTRKIPSLTALVIKKLFTKNLLGKLPKKRRRVKSENFDNDNDFGEISSDINDIISSLGDDMGNGSIDRKDLTAKIKDIIGCLDYDDNDCEVDESNGRSDDKRENKNENLKTNEYNDNSKVTSEPSNVDLNDSVTQNNDSNRINERNEKLDRIDTEIENHLKVNEDKGITDLNTDVENHSNVKNDDDDRRVHDLNTEIEMHSNINHDDDRVDDQNTEIENHSNINHDDDRVDDQNTEIENHSNINNDDSKVDDFNTEIENHSNINHDDDRVDDQNTEIDNHSNINNDDSKVDDFNTEIENHSNINHDDDRVDDQNTEIENHSNINHEEDKSIDKNESNINNDTRLDRPDTESYIHSKTDKEISKLDTESEKTLYINNDKTEIDESSKNSIENEHVPNGHHGNDNFEDLTKNDSNTNENKQFNKESPIKHSIDNLIGESDKNPDKYISEVISSLEDIIQKNTRNEMNHEHVNGNEMEHKNENEMKDKRLSDSDKITLEDLLPKEDRPSDLLDNISDDDFNFDA